jgi:hypothetical protein
MSKITRFVALAALVATAGSLAAHAQAEPTADQVARSLGEMEWHASVCHLPTAPLEAALERYSQRVRAGSLEAEHLSQELLTGRAEYERLFGSHMNCDGAAAEVAAIIAKIDGYGTR